MGMYWAHGGMVGCGKEGIEVVVGCSVGVGSKEGDTVGGTDGTRYESSYVKAALGHKHCPPRVIVSKQVLLRAEVFVQSQQNSEPSLP